MEAAGVPIVPGSGALKDAGEAVDTAARIGYPIMIKASAGGGGIGMRIARDEAELRGGLEATQSMAERAFGDPTVFLERYVEEPRHIEIQVLADAHGGVVYLGERECSIQRRHQKLVEESPSSFVTPEMRRRMGEAACRVAAAVGYVNAGTVEFLVDRERTFYFLEMNTRLQVEHPVTELVTGRDLVKDQLRIAAGEKLGFGQDDVALHGWAIECRINAEDPFASFIPSPGTVVGLRAPGGPWVRDDTGVYAGCTIPRFYDTLMAKLIVWGPDREAAIARMTRALGEYKVAGVQTTIPILERIIRHPDFVAGLLSTGFMERLLAADKPEGAGRHRKIALIAAALTAYKRAGRPASAVGSSSGPATTPSAWRQALRPGWRSR